MIISWSDESTTVDPESGDLVPTFTFHALEFDAIESESHEAAAEATDQAVERGVSITDHVRPLPRRISFEARVTNTPLGAPPASGDASSITASYTRAEESGATVLVFSDTFDRVADVIAVLENLRSTSTLITVESLHKVYEQAVILRVLEPRSPGEGGSSRRFVIDIREIRIAESRTIEVPQAREPRGSRTTDRGAQETQDGTRQSSALARAQDDYETRRDAGESRSDAALGALGAAFGG